MPLRPSTRPRRRGQGVTTFVVGFAAGAALMVGAQSFLDANEDPDLAHYRQVRDFVSSSFVRDVDPDELLMSALKGMVGELDPYSRYYDQVESQEVERETRGSFVGIGAVFKGDLSKGRILFPLPGSPAEAAGLRVGDRILSIDDAAIEGWDRAQVQDALQGELGSLVTLQVVGLDGEHRAVEIRRGSVVDPNVRHARILDETQGVGYLAILGFSHETPDEFDAAFTHLREQGMRSLVIDLRGNPGGVLKAAIEIARRFVPDGLIVSTEGRGTPVPYYAERAEAWYQGFPLVVLVDEGSASASEVLAGALQDHRAAVLVGAPTHGKGVVQTIRHYDDRKTIAKVTTSYFYTPAHRNLQRDPKSGRDYGIAPDLEVPINDAERAAIMAHTWHFSTPLDSVRALRDWERELGEPLIDPHPVDAQLDAAVQLLTGELQVASDGQD